MQRRDLALFFFVAVYLWTDRALAQAIGTMTRFNTLANTSISWIQGLALLGAVLGFVRVGYMYTQGDQHASESLKNTGIGAAIIAGATILMQFVKTQLAA